MAKKRKPQTVTKGRAAEIDKIVGSNIRAIRTRAEMSQSELGQKLGITFQQVQKYEKGTNRISSGRIIQLCQIFGVSTAQLLSQSEQAKEGLVFDGAAFKVAKVVHDLPPDFQKLATIIIRSIEEMAKSYPDSD